MLDPGATRNPAMTFDDAWDALDAGSELIDRGHWRNSAKALNLP